MRSIIKTGQRDTEVSMSNNLLLLKSFFFNMKKITELLLIKRYKCSTTYTVDLFSVFSGRGKNIIFAN